MTDKEKIRAFVERRLMLLKPDITFIFQRNELEHLLSFIDSMQEEPVSDDLLEIAIELEETIGTSPHSRLTIIESLVKAAKWQKSQMMKEAVDATVGFRFHRLSIDLKDNGISGFESGDKVKLIIVKEG